MRGLVALLFASLACTARNPAWEAPPGTGAAEDGAVHDAAGGQEAAPPRSPDVAAALDGGGGGTASGGSDAVIERAAAHGVALLVVGDLALSRSDVQLQDSLTRLGFLVALKEGSASSAPDAIGRSVVIISGSAWSDDVGGKFRDVTVPAVVFDEALFSPMKMTGPREGADFGLVYDERRLVILTPEHPLAAGLTGTVMVANDLMTISWGVPVNTAARIASLVGQPDRLTIFGYETGAVMVNFLAPARRVGSFVRYPGDGTYTDAGLRLFEASVLWATGAL
jgi:hypothetical protein